MEILSLHEVPEPPVRGLSRTQAILLSCGVHLLVLLAVLFVPERLPEWLRAYLAPQPAPAAARPAAMAAVPPADPALPAAPAPPKKQDRIPLKFAYVKVPDDQAIAANPAARLLSDKNRRARQEMPTPPDARQLSSDPHSKGDSADRVRPDPSLPAGLDTPREPAAARNGVPEPSDGAPGPLAGGRAVSGELGTLTPPAAEGRGGAAGAPDPSPPRPEGEARGAAGETTGDPAGRPRLDPSRTGHPGAPGEEARGGMRDAVSEWRPGEFKFIYNNPAYLRGGIHGTLSFDTKDFPWGDYARQIYVIVRNNWLARYPLAAREGLRGYACWKVSIERSGGVGGLQMVGSSSVPPFERAAHDALRASDPLPPLPEEFPKDSEGVTFCFYYNMHPDEAD